MLTRAALAGLFMLSAALAQTPPAATPSGRAGVRGPAQPVFVQSPRQDWLPDVPTAEEEV